MELRFTKKQEEVQAAARHFAETEITPLVPLMERERAFPHHLVRRMAEQGFMGIPIPTAWGGAGLDFISYMIAIHEFSRISAAAGVILSVHTSVCTLPILFYGSDEQRSSYVQKLASGVWLGAFALTEPHAGSDAASIRTTAVRQGDHYRLNGSKIFITNAGAADVYVTFAVTDRTKGAGGITAFLVNRNEQGLKIGKSEEKMGLHGSNTCELFYEEMLIPVEQRLGQEGEGFRIAMGSLDGGRIGIGAQALGIAEAALQLLQQRLNTPAIMGKARRMKRTNAAVLVELAELTARVEAARLLVYRAAYLRQKGLPCTKEASTAKMFASDTAVEVSGVAVRLLGREGCVSDHGAERLFRDAKVTQIYEGTNEIHRIVISSQLLR